MNFDPNLLDNFLKFTQILFYLTTGIIVILTYRKAKDTLLNSVNVEYQKKVIDRLDSLTRELGSEFDSNSSNWWAHNNPIPEGVDKINQVFADRQEELKELGHYPYGVILSTQELRLHRILEDIEFDPFIPEHIRLKTQTVLGERLMTLSDVYFRELEKYSKSLVKGGKTFSTSGDDGEFDKFHNKIIDKLNKKEAGITNYYEQIHEIRYEVQDYLDSFNPMKGKDTRQAQKRISK